MEEEKTVDPIFKKGFEHGYWLQRGDSKELRELMHKAGKHEGYYSGLKAGRDEAIREQVRDEFKQMDDNKQKDTGLDIG